MFLDQCPKVDLPFMFKADGEQEQMQENPAAHLNKLQQMAVAYLIAQVFGRGPVGSIAAAVLGSGCGGGGVSTASLGMLQNLFSMACSKLV